MANEQGQASLDNVNHWFEIVVCIDIANAVAHVCFWGKQHRR